MTTSIRKMTKRKVNTHNNNYPPSYFQEEVPKKQINHTKTLHSKHGPVAAATITTTSNNTSTNSKKTKKYKSVGTQTSHSSVSGIGLHYVEALTFRNSIDEGSISRISHDTDLEYLYRFVNSFQ